MAKLFYITGNATKFQLADQTCRPFGINLLQTTQHIDEIQGEDAEVITRDKAAKAFALQGQPLVVSDDSWFIPGLKGFPGPYMKSVNIWFDVADWLNLTRPLTDRRIFLRLSIVYQDEAGQRLFTSESEGLLLTEARGKSPHAHCHITSFDNGQHTMAEFHERNVGGLRSSRHAWHDFAEWYSERHD